MIHSYVRVRGRKQKTHTEDVVDAICEGHADNFDCHANPFVHTLPYVGITSTKSIHSALQVDLDMHRRRNPVVPAARFAKFIEQPFSFSMWEHIIPQTLQLVLVLKNRECKRA